MKDRYHKKANVLGIDVSVMRVDKAVNVSMELMRGKGLPVIYFLSAISSLLCQNNEQSAEYVKSCNLILAGDRHIEMAVHHRQDNGQIPEGIGEFADNYLKRLFLHGNGWWQFLLFGGYSADWYSGPCRYACERT